MCESRGPTYVSLRLNRNICSICVSYLKRDVSTIVTISHLSAILSFCIYVASIFNATYMRLYASLKTALICDSLYNATYDSLKPT